MLVIQRKRGERIMLDNGVTIELIDLHGNRARIGVSAPPEVKIVREELLQQRPFRKAVRSAVGLISPIGPISPIGTITPIANPQP